MDYKRYAEIRDSVGMKDFDVSKASGIGSSTFSDWKNGRSNPKEPKLMKIAAALGVTYAYMIGMESEPNPATAVLEYNISYNAEHGGNSKASEFLYRTSSNFQFSKSEVELIKKFREASPEVKSAIATLLAFALDQEKKNNDD